MCPCYMLEYFLGICLGEWFYQLAVLPAVEECFSFSRACSTSAVT
ncbi:hypothetical protein T09_5353 [Trichinella sp. T9]|nr:hypothetical protein T09_5353 [Trichinella sp. T9]